MDVKRPSVHHSWICSKYMRNPITEIEMGPLSQVLMLVLYKSISKEPVSTA